MASDYEDFDENFDEDFDEDSHEFAPFDVALASLEDSDRMVRVSGDWITLRQLEPAALAQHAEAVVARLEDADGVRGRYVRKLALQTLGKLEPATLAQHADAIAARLEDSFDRVCVSALRSLSKLEPATFTRYASAVIAMVEHDNQIVRDEAMLTLRVLPRLVPHGYSNLLDSRSSRSRLQDRLLGRLAWYRCRIRLRGKSLALYWYSLPYRPSGPGHARDVEVWDRMLAHREQSETVAAKKRHAAADGTDGEAAEGAPRENRRQTRHTKRKK